MLHGDAVTPARLRFANRHRLSSEIGISTTAGDRTVTDPRGAPERDDPDDSPMILVAAGRREGDAAEIWTALLEIAPTAAVRGDRPPEPVESTGSSGTAVAVAAAGIDAAVARMRSLLDGGHDRLVVVAAGALDPTIDPLTWQAPLAAAVDAIRAAYPHADIHDLGRPTRDLAASTLSDVIAIPRNDSPAMLAGAIVRGFGGDPAALARFIAHLRAALPAGTTIALRGSSVAGHRYSEDVPFDADGPGTSDLDVVAIGEDAVGLWVPEARLMGGINTLPLSDKAPWVAPALDPARRQAQALVERPLSIQAMAGWFLDLRALVQRHPYVILNEPS